MRSFCKVKCLVNRSVFVSSLVLLLMITANAYTVVMRGGRRVEIPSNFSVTQKTLTYEVSQGIQVTLAMAAIDVPATERANNEQPGSLLRRSQVAPGDSSALQAAANASRATAKRTITNLDLETSVKRRRDSEVAYEIKRKQLGLPSLEESRKQAAAVPDFTGTELEQQLVAESESEEYWRTRATALRTELAALDAELSYIRARLDEMPSGLWTGSSVIASGALPFISFGDSFGNVGGRRSFPGAVGHRSQVFGTRSGAQVSGRIRFGGGATRGQVLLNPRGFHGRRPFGGGPIGAFPGGVVFGGIGQPYDFSYERSELVTQFNELATARAGLMARWRELEDEARRAGAPPGWLRR